MSWEMALGPLVAGLIASVRIAVMLLTGPFFGHLALPAGMRVAFASVLAWLIAPGFAPHSDWQSWGVAEFGGAIAVEAGIGLVLGFSARLIFTGFELLGEFISTQGGLGAARFLDPGSGTASAALGRAFHTFGLLVFLSIDGHHQFLRAVGQSFEALPVGGGAPEVEAFMAVAGLVGAVFEVALRLSAPLTVAIFVQNVAMGVMARAMPQLNLMMVQLPGHIALLLMIIGLGASDLLNAVRGVLEAWPDSVAGALLGAG